MNSKELSDKFIHHSPGFYKDLDLKDIDDKHQGIVQEAYKKINTNDAFNSKNFRNFF